MSDDVVKDILEKSGGDPVLAKMMLAEHVRAERFKIKSDQLMDHLKIDIEEILAVDWDEAQRDERNAYVNDAIAEYERREQALADEYGYDFADVPRVERW